MKTLIASALVLAAIPAFAQEAPMTQTSSSVNGFIMGRSDVGALASILSRRTPEESAVVVRTLEKLQGRGKREGDAPNYGARSIAEILLETAGDDRSAFEAAWGRMDSFDKESLSILARAAAFGGFTSTEGGRGLSFLSGGVPGMMRVRVPERAIIDSLAMKMGDQGEVFRAAVLAIDANTKSAIAPIPYAAAEERLVLAIPADRRDAFVNAWKTWDYDVREAAATIVRDAADNGIDDL